MYVKMRSDISLSGRGFKAQYVTGKYFSRKIVQLTQFIISLFTEDEAFSYNVDIVLRTVLISHKS